MQQSFLKILETPLKPKRNKAIQDRYRKENNTQGLRGGLQLGVGLPYGKHISHPVYVSTINQCKAKQPGNQKAAETSVEGRAMTANSSLNNNSVFPMGLPVHIIAVRSMQR